MKNYFVFNPDVFLFRKERQTLIYNSCSGERLQVSNEDFDNVFCSSIGISNTYLLKSDFDNNKKLDFLLKKLDKAYGDKVKCNTPPFQLSPVLNVQSESSTGFGLFDDRSSPYYHLKELTVYFDNPLNNSKAAYNQFIWPVDDSKNDSYEIDGLISFAKPLLKTKSLAILNIVAYRLNKSVADFILKKSKYNNLMISLYLNAKSLDDSIPISDLQNLKIHVCVDHVSDFKSTFFEFKDRKNLIFEFKINSIDEYNQYQNITSQISNYTFRPFFNYRNLDFFEKNIYLDETDLENLKPTKREVFINQKLNSNYYGKITIACNGKVFTNPGSYELGDVNNCNPITILNAIDNEESNWFLTRSKVEPCRDCHFCYLCPPISNYENEINRFNLCTVLNN